jgi:hypothetical protein
MHAAGTKQHLGDEQISCFKTPAHYIHTSQQPFVKNFPGSHTVVKRLLGKFCDFILFAGDQLICHLLK